MKRKKIWGKIAQYDRAKDKCFCYKFLSAQGLKKM
jgi:hypothetical protein